MVNRYALVAASHAELMKTPRKSPHVLLKELIARMHNEGRIAGTKSGVSGFARMIDKDPAYVHAMLNEKLNRFGSRRQREIEKKLGLPQGWFADGGDLSDKIREYRALLWETFTQTLAYHSVKTGAPQTLEFLKNTYEAMPMDGPPYPTVATLEGIAGVMLGTLNTRSEIEEVINRTNELYTKATDDTQKTPSSKADLAAPLTTKSTRKKTPK